MAADSHLYLQILFGYGWRNRVPMCRKAFHIELGRLPGVSKGLFSRLALRDAPGERWHLRNEYTILIRLDKNSEFHFRTPQLGCPTDSRAVYIRYSHQGPKLKELVVVLAPHLRDTSSSVAHGA